MSDFARELLHVHHGTRARDRKACVQKIWWWWWTVLSNKSVQISPTEGFGWDEIWSLISWSTTDHLSHSEPSRAVCWGLLLCLYTLLTITTIIRGSDTAWGLVRESLCKWHDDYWLQEDPRISYDSFTKQCISKACSSRKDPTHPFPCTVYTYSIWKKTRAHPDQL